MGNENTSATIKEQYAFLQSRLTRVSEDSHLSNTPPHIIAVSKKQPEARIEKALACGIRHFGENRVQEAQSRWQPRKADYPDLTLHLIGPLQSNKAAEAVTLFDVIHSVDRKKIADALAKEMQKQDKHVPCFVQVNTGNESQKSGVSPEEAENFVRYCVQEARLNIIGLMCIPPASENPAPHFALLKQLADMLGLKELSMGMSNDYELAARLGATYVRLGTCLFGERNQ